MKNKITFNPVYITSSQQLETLVRDNIQTKEVSHYLFINDWDKLSNYYSTRIQKDLEGKGNNTDLYVISVFDVPNALQILRSCIKEFRETISTNAIQNYTGLPMLVRLHGAFPVVVSYSGSILSELGLLN